MSNLYFHFPFCKQACHYCNFHFSTNTKNQVDSYVEGHSMQRELDIRSDEVQVHLCKASILGEDLTSHYCLPIQIAALLDKLFSLNLRFMSPLEITLEVNPDDVSAAYLSDLKHAGVNRLSLGVQSFSR